MNQVKVKGSLLLAAVMAMVSPLAMAAVDVTAVVTDILAAAAPIALIGGAVLTIHYGAKVFKWVRKAG